MNHRDYLKKKLRSFNAEDIVITDHALIRMERRQIKREEVIENIINPKRLEVAVKEKADYLPEEKYDCYFGYSKTLCHRYVIVIKNDIVVVTVIKINRRWQRAAEKRLKR